MEAASRTEPTPSLLHSPLRVDLVVPVYNEQDDLEPAVRRLVGHCRSELPYTFRVTIVDNGSTDSTWSIARRLERSIAEVRAVHLDRKGRGRALRATWTASEAEVVAYMDVDLSTDLKALLPLVAPLLSGHSDVAIGTRLAYGARVRRGWKRETISRCYNLLLHALLRVRFSDAQCGFKAVRAERARQLLPQVEDQAWFFDTELLVLAQDNGLRIHEVPVDWVDDPDSRVDVARTALADLRGVLRMQRARWSRLVARQLVSFCLVGGVSNLAYVALYWLLRGLLPAQAANGLSLLITAVANTAANRRLTFGVRDPRGRVRHQAHGLLVFALGLAVTGGSLALLQRLDPAAARPAELAVLVAASVVATLLRFALFRVWMFPQQPTCVKPRGIMGTTRVSAGRS